MGYGFTPRFRAELVLPYIHREFRRASHDGDVERDSESGLGDITVLGRYTALDRVVSDESLVRVELFARAELPTGDSDLRKEEESDDGGHHEDEAPSGIHDHDLALGSGSLDAILGTNAFATWKRLYNTSGFQYSVRGNGNHDDRFANDLHFHTSLGALLILRHDASLGFAARLAGETKGKDTQGGEKEDGSGITAV